MGAETTLLLLGFRRQCNGDFGGTIRYADLNYPAVIGAFEMRDILNEAGGFSPSLMAVATVAREDLTAPNIAFKRGATVKATPGDTTRPSRMCQIYSVTDCGPLIELTLHDKHQGA